MYSLNRMQLIQLCAIVTTTLLVSACQGLRTQAQACSVPGGPNLEQAVAEAKDDLSGVCSYRYDDYFRRLLEIAEDDPKPENRQLFSEFLVWSQHNGLLSRRQAEDRYNRYFNLKFVSLKGDYNNCSSTCPNKRQVLRNMEQELVDKEQGLLKISRDRVAYQRADRLFQETELVLEATCNACSSQ